MTTQQVADRLIELMRQGDSETAYKELFAEDASGHEMPGVPDGDTFGRDALLAKNAASDENFEEIHELDVSDPLVYGEHFAVGMMIDVTKKGGERTKEEEMCVYHVRGGKIQSERFIYAMS